MTTAEIALAKKFVIDRLLSTKRENIDELIRHMETIGFFTAPCSGGNHLACDNGLLMHTKNVIEIAETVGKTLYGDLYEGMEDSIILCAALHDLGKCGQFGKSEYVPNILKGGNQSDIKPYVRNKNLINVPHEVRSVVIATMFIDLEENEQHAILYHNGMYGALKYELQGTETPLYLLIHFADMWASRVIEWRM